MGKPLRVLLVEDSKDDAELLLRALARDGYEPVCSRVETAPAMRSALADGEWDVVLSDYHMPGMNGAALLRELRRCRPPLATVPFMLFSGFIDHWTGTAADPAPDVVLSKPMTIEHLIAEINSVLRRRQPAAASLAATAARGNAGGN